MNKILVTGTYGFIGSHFLKLLIDKGYEPVSLGRRTSVGDKRRLENIDKYKYRDYEGDINNIKLMKEIIKDNAVDTIVNFAASSNVDNSIEDVRPFIYNNIIGICNLLELVKDHNLRLIQISTDECYGSTTNNDQMFKESDRLTPGNPYSSSKSCGDLLCVAYINTYKLPIIITRSSNNYGKHQHKEKFIPKMISLAMEGKDLELYGNGENIRDWLYVEDNCRGILSVVENGKLGEIYNIGGGNELTNNYIASLISKRFGVDINYIEDRKGHDKRYSIDCSKIIDELGWKPTKKFEDGINDTIDWYINEEKRKNLEATK